LGLSLHAENTHADRLGKQLYSARCPGKHSTAMPHTLVVFKTLTLQNNVHTSTKNN